MDYTDTSVPAIASRRNDYFRLLQNELKAKLQQWNIDRPELIHTLSEQAFTPDSGTEILELIDELETRFVDEYNLALQKKERLTYFYENNPEYEFDLDTFKDRYFNESLSDLVRNQDEKYRILEYDDRLLQRIDPIYNLGAAPGNGLDYRTHFFAPKKHLFSHYFDTFWFNIAVIWCMTIILYIALYFEWLKKLVLAMDVTGKKLKWY
jgi:hypothetical protein